MTKVQLVAHPTNGRFARIIEAYLADDGTPVLIREGQSGDALLPDGRSTREVPHISVAIGGGTFNGVTYYAGYTVSAVDAMPPGPGVGPRTLVVHADSSSERAPLESLVAKAKTHVPAARTCLATIAETYERAGHRIAELDRYPRFLSRAAYEAACQECGVEAYPDAQCSTCGEFNFPFYAADVVVQKILAQRRAYEIERVREDRQRSASARRGARPSTPQMEGQLWEECPLCGREPVFLPLMVCEECWPAD